MVLTVRSAGECMFWGIHSGVRWQPGRLRQSAERGGGWEKQKPRGSISGGGGCRVGQMIYFMSIFQTLRFLSHHRVQIAMDLEVQQVLDEIHPRRVKRCGSRPGHHLGRGRV